MNPLPQNLRISISIHHALYRWVYSSLHIHTLIYTHAYDAQVTKFYLIVLGNSFVMCCCSCTNFFEHLSHNLSTCVIIKHLTVIHYCTMPSIESILRDMMEVIHMALHCYNMNIMNPLSQNLRIPISIHHAPKKLYRWS